MNLRFLVLAAAIACPTLAKGSDEVHQIVDLSGSWTFKTGAFNSRNCTMHGELLVAPGPKPGRYAGALTTHEVCDGADIVIVAEQTSILRQINDAVLIRSEVDIVDPPVPYSADHFDLRVIAPNLMRGRLKANVTAAAEFQRGEGRPGS